MTYIPRKDYDALTARVAELEAALRPLYEKYVVDMHGETVCDCDTHVETCAPCLARAVLVAAKGDKA